MNKVDLIVNRIKNLPFRKKHTLRRYNSSSENKNSISKGNSRNKSIHFQKSLSLSNNSTTYISKNNNDPSPALYRTVYIPNRQANPRLPLAFTTNTFFIPKKHKLPTKPKKFKLFKSQSQKLLTPKRKKKIFFFEKTKALEEKINKKNLAINRNLKKIQKEIEKKSYYKQKQNEMRNIRLKMKKMIDSDQFHICKDFEEKIYIHNFNVTDYLNGEKYLNLRENFQTRLNFCKTDLCSGHDLYTQIVDIDKIREGKIDSIEIFQSLNDNEKKLVLLDPSYFVKDKTYFEKVGNKLKSKTLAMKLNEEEEESKEKKYNRDLAKVNSLLKETRNAERIPEKREESWTIREDHEKKMNKKLNKALDVRFKLMKSKSTGELMMEEIDKMKTRIAHINKVKSYFEFYREKIMSNHSFIPAKWKKEHLIKLNRERLEWEKEIQEVLKSNVEKKNYEDYLLRGFLERLKKNIAQK